uniref:Uncharacterized protein n=1 Tax=Arundo donax TaxID=35708 RepID=A0A0A8XZD2_ARUDO
MGLHSSAMLYYC